MPSLTATACTAALVAFATIAAFAAGGLSTAASPSNKPTSPWFCHGLECPAFKTVGTGGGKDGRPPYEVRSYDRSVWASTTLSAYTLATAQARGFQRLFDYISGANDKNVSIPMTAPVLTSLPDTPPSGPFCVANWTVSFLVPAKFSSRPPRPLDPAVYISSLPATSYYVASRGGWAWESDTAVAKAASELVDAAKADGRPASLKKGVPWFVAGYDPPFRLRGRHTEVWVAVPPEEREGGAGQPGLGVA